MSLKISGILEGTISCKYTASVGTEARLTKHDNFVEEKDIHHIDKVDHILWNFLEALC
ncbi:1618_t:CDS:2 [Entrophospora sp. SA101]|nr:1618_t:CDS:2 [Entrophospora sp. SA101]